MWRVPGIAPCVRPALLLKTPYCSRYGNLVIYANARIT